MDTVITWFDSLPLIIQIIALFVIGVIPFLESYVGGFLGGLFDLPIAVAFLAPVAGNLLAVFVAVRWAGRVADKRADRERTPRQEKILARVNRYGIPGAALLAPTLLAISITAFLMVVSGLDRRLTLIWNGVAVLVWGAGFLIAGYGLNAAVGG